MRIGELLLLHERVDPWVLTNTLKGQAPTRQRLVSLLISRAQLDPDDGAMLLREQLGYPAAMQRHLERADRSLLSLFPPELGARWVILPLGRARTGAIVVAARDPTPILTAALEHITKQSIVLAVTPSLQLEKLVRAAYGVALPADEPLPESPPTLSEIGNARIDDVLPLPIRRARTVSYHLNGMDLPDRPQRAVAPIDEILRDIDRAITPATAERIVMTYVARRWKTALLARINGDVALGVRGHGPRLMKAELVTVPLMSPSLISLARDTGRLTTELPSSASQTQLTDLLESPRTPIAAPVLVADKVHSVLAVGDAHIGSDSRGELDRLADALGWAYERSVR
ncbi:MAG: hypothetical protein H0T46_21555 [Deltaproteobacteria bacterium]|nr:hypothetical protein [Deltaproteobacteria bacterium]